MDASTATLHVTHREEGGRTFLRIQRPVLGSCSWSDSLWPPSVESRATDFQAIAASCGLDAEQLVGRLGREVDGYFSAAKITPISGGAGFELELEGDDVWSSDVKERLRDCLKAVYGVHMVNFRPMELSQATAAD